MTQKKIRSDDAIALVAHIAATNPHPQYLTEAEAISLFGDGESQSLKIPFNFGDASPLPIYQVQGVVYSVSIAIIVPFNGSPSVLKVGDTSVSDRLLRADQVDPFVEGEYEANPCYLYSSPTQLYLSIVPGDGITQGSGFVILEV